jgi:hypothetical protein
LKVTLISPYSDITAHGLRCLSAYLKLLLKLTGSRWPVPRLKLLAHPKLLTWFNRPGMLSLLPNYGNLRSGCCCATGGP